MSWTSKFPRLAAIVLFNIAMMSAHCGDKSAKENPTQEDVPAVDISSEEIDTSDHDVVTSEGKPIAEVYDEENQDQNIIKDKESEANPCKTKYPILLVHGVALRDKLLGLNYFGRIPYYLRKNCKVDVYQGGQDAFSVITVNADQLRERILYLTDTLGYKKVNIIAHSKGGLDIRMMFHMSKGEMIDGLTMNDRVASFTTLSSPHRGAIIADFILSRTGPLTEKILFMALNIFGFMQKDSKDSDSEVAMTSLSPSKMAEFNKQMGDLETGIPKVYCQSWSSNISGYIFDAALWTGSKMIASTGQKINDGAVEEPSTHYGNYRGTVGKGLFGGVSHFAIVDRAAGIVPGVTPGFNVLTFYKDMLTELKAKGY